MAILMGEGGCIELRRNSADEEFSGIVHASDVNATKNRFSFDFPFQTLITGDLIEIKTERGYYLNFIDPNAWPGNTGLPLPPPGPFADYANARVLCRKGRSREYENSEIESAGVSIETDYKNGFTSAAFDPGTADYDNADVTPRSDIGFLTQYRSGTFYVNVDDAGALRLYDKFDDALRGEIAQRINLIVPPHNIPAKVQVLDNPERILAQIKDFEVNTERESVDTSALSDDFRKQYSGLISGSGRITCFFEYEARSNCGFMLAVADRFEVPIYMNHLLLRTRMGSEFWAKVVLVRRGYKPYGTDDDTDDMVWYEFEGIITNIAMTFAPGQPIESVIDYVTTGEIKLHTKRVSNYLTQEDTSLILLENKQVGALEVEQQQD